MPARSGDLKAYPSDAEAFDSIYQILDETFTEGATYTLSVWVGNAWPGEGYADGWGLYFTGENYNVNLIEAHGLALSGDWEQISLDYTATDADAGERIGIKMSGEEGESYIAFEDVTLSFEAPTIAKQPTPADGAGDVPATTTLTWTPGQGATGHDVYLGEGFADVNEATRSDGRGVLVEQEQNAATYDPPGDLEFSKTYYWRIDELEAGGATVHKGYVWSFTIEPLAYPVENVVATSNGISDAGIGPERTVDGSGLNADDQHSTSATDMWLAAPGEEPISIQYEFEQIHKLHEMLLWNYNEQFELMLGFGIKDVTVEYSIDGIDWTVLGERELAQATAQTDYTANTTIDFGGVAARFVRLTVNSGWGPQGQFFGLSEVRFLSIPAHAREPQPEEGATDVSVATLLGWRAGREAVSHEVYLGTDADALALVDTVETTRYTPGNLEFGLDYFWKIDEVNEADEISVWEGGIWSFGTQEYAVIDDFESYDDENRIYESWLDGWVNETGSTVGYLEAPFAETTIVNSGRQSMPFHYDNSDGISVSEVEKDLGDMNLTAHGADSLRLFLSSLAPAFYEGTEGTILMNGIGNDIWNAADQFRYAYKPLNGNGSMIARVDYVDGSPDAWAKAGVMIRQDTPVGAVNTFMAMTGGDGGGATFQQRLEADGVSVSQHSYDDGPLAPPYWVKVTRVGNVFQGFTSADGATWTPRGDTVTIDMADPVLIGLAVTSHNVNQATGAEFSNVSTTGNVSGAWQIAEIGATQPVGNDVQPIYVALDGSVVVSPDAAATGKPGWTEWVIPLSEFGGNLSNVQSITIGVGNPNNGTSGTGLVFIDDIGFGRPAADQ